MNEGLRPGLPVVAIASRCPSIVRLFPSTIPLTGARGNAVP